MTRAEFAAKIKAKYPGYASIPDEDLVDKILAKHPVYQSQIDDKPAPISDEQRVAQFNKAHENDWPAPIDVPPDTGDNNNISTGSVLGGELTGVKNRLGDLITGPYRQLQQDFENDARPFSVKGTLLGDTGGYGPIAGPLKTIITKSTLPLLMAEQATKGLKSGATQAANYYQQGKPGLAAASLIPVVGQTVPAMNQIEEGYQKNDADQMGQGVGSILTDVGVNAAPFISKTPSVLPKGMTDAAVAKGVGNAGAKLATLPFTAGGSITSRLLGPVLERVFGAKGEAPTSQVTPGIPEGPPTLDTVANQAYQQTTPKGLTTQKIREFLNSGMSPEEAAAKVTAEKQAAKVKPTKAAKESSNFTPPAVDMSFNPGQLAGMEPVSWQDALKKISPNPEPAESSTGLEPQAGTTSGPLADLLSRIIPKQPEVPTPVKTGTPIKGLAGTNSGISMEDMLRSQMAKYIKSNPQVEAPEPISESILSPEPPPSLGAKGMTAPEVTAATNAAGIRAQIDKLLSENPQGLNARGQELLNNLKTQLAQYEAKRTARAVMPGIRRQ